MEYDRNTVAQLFLFYFWFPKTTWVKSDGLHRTLMALVQIHVRRVTPYVYA